jgi:hypothetical protein
MQASNEQTNRPLIKKANVLSGSVYVGIHPKLVKQLGVDDLTYFEETITDEGNVLLKPRRLT